MTKATISTEALDAALTLVGAATNINGLSTIVQALYTTIESAEARSFTAGYKAGYEACEADSGIERSTQIDLPTETIDDEDLKTAAALLDDSDPIGEVTRDRINAQVEGARLEDVVYTPVVKDPLPF